MHYPVGHSRRREEGIPLLNAKFERHVSPWFEKEHLDKSVAFFSRSAPLHSLAWLQRYRHNAPSLLRCQPCAEADVFTANRIVKLTGDQSTLEKMSVKDFTDLFVTKE